MIKNLLKQILILNSLRKSDDNFQREVSVLLHPGPVCQAAAGWPAGARLHHGSLQLCDAEGLAPPDQDRAESLRYHGPGLPQGIRPRKVAPATQLNA